MTINIEKLIDWLGPKGAIAGLSESDVTISEISELVKNLSWDKPVGFSKMKREEMIVWMICEARSHSKKTNEELGEMDYDSLVTYFKEIKITNEELSELLTSFGFSTKSTRKRNALEFAAREISDLGMYKRVSMGAQCNNV
ncbi:MAG: hypothetical protein WAO71_14580 [Gallionella sp.]